MIKQVKNRLVQEHIQGFLEKMLRLGFDHEEILSAISAIMEAKK